MGKILKILKILEGLSLIAGFGATCILLFFLITQGWIRAYEPIQIVRYAEIIISIIAIPLLFKMAIEKGLEII